MSSATQATAQTGLLSAIRRLFTSSQTSDVNDQDNNPPLPDRRGSMMPAGGNAANFRRKSREQRATIFARQSTGGHSSVTSSGGPVGPDVDDSSSPNGEVYCLPDATIHTLRRIINHQAWTVITLFFILVLLFGPPIRDIWLPKTWDGFMDGTFTLGFIILAFDIITRCIVDKSYFSWSREARSWSLHSCNTNICNWHAGSHMFWFDTVALLTILYRVSYINPNLAKQISIHVRLNAIGFPCPGQRHATPMPFDWPLVFTVGRVSLMARFIRTSFLVKVSSNWSCLQYFFPKYWISKCKREKKEERRIQASERVLVSSIKGRGLDRNSDPFSVSSLGESSTRKRMGSIKRASGLGSELEHSLEESGSLPPKAKSKPTNVKDFFKSFVRKASDATIDSSEKVPPNAGTGSMFGNNDRKDSRSHVGTAMRELTGQRIATGALLALLMTVICDWHEVDTTKVMTMLTLHGQTASESFAARYVEVARSSVIPSLYNFTRANETEIIFSEEFQDVAWTELREREILSVLVSEEDSDAYTSGDFDNSQVNRDRAKVELLTEALLLFIWVLGVAAFASPVMTLVVEPIERMVRLLSMLMKDPLGYSSTPQYQQLMHEGDGLSDKYKSMWPKEVLKGMETNFLMSTILRIGSLMRVGFGSAGVEIIRNNLERGRHKDVLFLSKQGGSVSCIFLFCDIRQFTDVTECLQEEVFVFTNKVAAVVHSICHSYGGSANKNIGDAFLVSWLLDKAPDEKEEDQDDPFSSSPNNLNRDGLYAKNNQADKALLSVVKISMALHYDNYYVDDMNETARNRLLTKLSGRKGPIVQIGFGLHAGNAVQGAIGSQRKLDATYISESVERAEFLESSTKTYGVPLLMSDAFYNLLDSSNRNRCRKVDQLIMLREDEDEGLDELLDNGEKMLLYTYDMDIDALWRPPSADDDNSTTNSDILQDMIQQQQRHTLGGQGSSVVSSLTKRRPTLPRRHSLIRETPGSSSISVPRNIGHLRGSLFIPNKDAHKTEIQKTIQAVAEEMAEKQPTMSKTLVLPTGVRHYDEKAWRESDIKKIRRDYVKNGIIFPKYQEALRSYCAKDWEHAKQCFEFVLTQRDDGPSRCFLRRMAENDGVPPRNFIGFTRSDEL